MISFLGAMHGRPDVTCSILLIMTYAGQEPSSLEANQDRRHYPLTTPSDDFTLSTPSPILRNHTLDHNLITKKRACAK
jgi:hypothetical protein